jgi:hypothetical protein
MARKKRSSRIIERAQRRLSSIQSINPQLALDGAISTKDYAKHIDELRQKLNAYNTALSTVDDLYNQFTDGERQLADYSEKMLLGVAVRYGKDSNEYEMAGGVRKQDRKRPRRTVSVG